jgi:hypothetical protein
VGEVADGEDAGADGVPGSLLAAAFLLAAQALALVVLAVIVIVKVVTGHPSNVGGALVGAALAALAALVLGQCGRAIYQRRPAGRTPVVVIELLALPVSYDLTFPAHRPGYGGPILVSALALLYLLFTPAARAALDRER